VINKFKSVYMQNVIDSFMGIVATLFLILVALPAYIFWLNSNDVSWQGALWISQFAVSMCIALLVAIILAMASGATRRFFNAIIVTIYVLVFIRAFFAPVSFGILEGLGINEVQIISDVSLWVSMVLLSVILLCALKYERLVKDIVQTSTVVLVLLVAYIYSSSGSSNAIIKASVADKSHLSRFSSNSNILVLSFDSIQNDLLIELLSENEEALDLLDDFTLYADVTGYAPNTSFSMLSTLTGRYIESGDKGAMIKNLRQIYGQVTFPSVLARHNYAVDVFNLPCNLAANSTCMNTASVLPKKNANDYRLTAYDISILKIFPKSISWGIVQSLSKNKRSAVKDEKALIKEDKAGHGYGMDKYTFKQMYKGMYLVDEPVLKFHHYMHTHQPIRFGKNCSYDTRIDQNHQSTKSEIYCTLREFGEFITRLKEIGIYNDALIILTSDHGYESNIQPRTKKGKDYNGGFININGVWSASRYWPILLVKKNGARGKLKMNYTPVSLVDIGPTIYKSANIDFCKNARCDGENLLANYKPRKKMRKSMFYVGGAQNLDNKHYDTKLFQSESIEGEAFSGIKNAMDRMFIDTEELVCGQIVIFNQNKGYFAYGVSGVESWGRWSDASIAKIQFSVDLDKCTENKLSIKVRGFVRRRHPSQHSEVFLNNVQIGEINIEIGEQNPRDFTFDIPSKLLKPGEINVLEFRIAEVSGCE